MQDEEDTYSRVYVKFGPGETDEMPVSLAVKMLTALRKENPAVFARYLMKAHGLEKVARA